MTEFDRKANELDYKELDDDLEKESCNLECSKLQK